MRKIYNILLMLTAVFSYGQVNLIVETEKNTRDFRENDEVIVNILLEVAGKDMVQQTPLRMFDTSKFDVIANGSDQNTFIDSKTGFRVNRTLYQYVLRPKRAGKIKIGSASVVINEKLYYTEPFDIFIVESDKKVIVDKNFDDVYLNVELGESEVYKNQPTVAVLRAYSKNFDNFRKVRDIRFPNQDNINIRQISHTKSEIEPSGNMASQILAVFLIYPKKSGRLELAPVSAHVSSDKHRIVSNKVKLKVKSLPKNSPADYKNAVGKFDVNLTYTGEKVEVEKPVNISVKISGEGNFGNLNLPKIKESPDYSVFSPKITRNTVSSNAGVKGDVTANYVIVPKKAGPITIFTENFSYFDPAANEYVDLGVKSLVLDAFTHNEILAARSPLERVNEYTNTVLETVDNPVIKTTGLKVKEKKALNWSAFWINLSVLFLAFFGFLLFRGYKRRNRDKKSTVQPRNLGSVAETEKEIRAGQKTDINDYFAFMTTLKDSRDYDRFFGTMEELDQEVQKQYEVNSVADLRASLEKNSGQQIAEEYRSLQHQIQIERYAPVHTPEYINDLLENAVNLYTQISK
jgi:hypothetical protein